MKEIIPSTPGHRKLLQQRKEQCKNTEGKLVCDIFLRLADLEDAIVELQDILRKKKLAE